MADSFWLCLERTPDILRNACDMMHQKKACGRYPRQGLEKAAQLSTAG